ncbi:DUF5681 domain-containing protein [Ruegeria atlantica]|uniref:DUF5681 domain-containing protein n=1 Tax=Ruegeria atlantica TaxID=81569 RepID=A0A0P1E0N8_9RHOB|nr:DUF5681 domain-containing protein [Ruegeria atlantica]CUH41201.1 hypothetical protein RUM4293_00066 [Ruegeria atlantica]
MSEDTKDYEVGYGKPPKATRFQKGRSGNPKGRPKGAKGVNASLKRELEAKITVREGNHEARISKAEAIAKRLTAGALKGDTKLLMALLKVDADLFGGSDDVNEQASAALEGPDKVDYDILRDFFSSDPDGDGGPENEEVEDDGS